VLEFRFWTLTDVDEDDVSFIHPPIRVEGWVSFSFVCDWRMYHEEQLLPASREIRCVLVI